MQGIDLALPVEVCVGWLLPPSRRGWRRSGSWKIPGSSINHGFESLLLISCVIWARLCLFGVFHIQASAFSYASEKRNLVECMIITHFTSFLWQHSCHQECQSWCGFLSATGVVLLHTAHSGPRHLDGEKSERKVTCSKQSWCLASSGKERVLPFPYCLVRTLGL